MKFPFPIDSFLSAIAIAYANKEYIAHLALPYVPVGLAEFKYHVFNKPDRYTIPNTLVGRKSEPNEVEFGATVVTASCLDYGLDDIIPQADIDNAPAGYDPIAIAAEGTTDLVLLDREKRVADVLKDTANYDAANVEDIVATKFSAAATDPIEIIESAKEGMMITPNTFTASHKVIGALRRNSNVIKAIHRNSGDKGIARHQDLEDLFNMVFLSGNAWLNTAAKGQAGSFSTVWGVDASMYFLNSVVNNPTHHGVTFGYTARHGDRVGGRIEEPKKGLRGSHRVRTGETVKELITATDAGYLFQNAI